MHVRVCYLRNISVTWYHSMSCCLNLSKARHMMSWENIFRGHHLSFNLSNSPNKWDHLAPTVPSSYLSYFVALQKEQCENIMSGTKDRWITVKLVTQNQKWHASRYQLMRDKDSLCFLWLMKLQALSEITSLFTHSVSPTIKDTVLHDKWFYYCVRHKSCAQPKQVYKTQFVRSQQQE